MEPISLLRVEFETRDLDLMPRTTSVRNATWSEQPNSSRVKPCSMYVYKPPERAFSFLGETSLWRIPRSVNIFSQEFSAISRISLEG